MNMMLKTQRGFLVTLYSKAYAFYFFGLFNFKAKLRTFRRAAFVEGSFF